MICFVLESANQIPIDIHEVCVLVVLYEVETPAEIDVAPVANLTIRFSPLEVVVQLLGLQFLNILRLSFVFRS